MAEDAGPPVPDPMEIRDMLSDVEDMKLADKLSEIVDRCAQQEQATPSK